MTTDGLACVSVSANGMRCGRRPGDHDIPIFLGSSTWSCSHGKRCLEIGHVFAPPCEVDNCGKSDSEHDCRCLCNGGNDPGYHCEDCDGGPLGHDFNETIDDL